ALVGSLVATLLGLGVGVLAGWRVGSGLALGLAISVASTVVLLRALVEARVLDSLSGHVAMGWLVVEDLLAVFVLVLLPAASGALGGVAATSSSGALTALGLTLLKVGGLVALVLLVGGRVVPWLLDRVARLESKELFTLAVLAIALGIACASASLVGVSLALGAFLAGM